MSSPLLKWIECPPNVWEVIGSNPFRDSDFSVSHARDMLVISFSHKVVNYVHNAGCHTQIQKLNLKDSIIHSVKVRVNAYVHNCISATLKCY